MSSSHLHSLLSSSTLSCYIIILLVQRKRLLLSRRIMKKTNFYCAYCAGLNKIFSTEKYAILHSRKLHPKLKPIVSRVGSSNRNCPWCNLQMSFSTFNTFYSHLSYCIMNPERKSVQHAFRCRNCGQVSKNFRVPIIHR